MPSSTPRQSAGANSIGSSSGLEIGSYVQSPNYAQELFKTYEDIATEQRETKRNPLATSETTKNMISSDRGNRSVSTENIVGQSPQVFPTQFPSLESPDQIQPSPGGILTPEGAKNIENSGFGPIAGLEPQANQGSFSSSIDVNTKNLYNETANVVSAQEAKGPEKMPEAPATPMPPAQSFSGKDRSAPSFGGGQNKNATLIQIAASKSMYPPWMLQGLMG